MTCSCKNPPLLWHPCPEENERREKAHLEYLRKINIKQIPIQQIADDLYPEDFEAVRDPDPPAECQLYSEAYIPNQF